MIDRKKKSKKEAPSSNGPKKRVENTRIYIKCYPSDLYLLFVAPKNKRKGGKIIFFYLLYYLFKGGNSSNVEDRMTKRGS
jgi:hypothetical protein